VRSKTLTAICASASLFGSMGGAVALPSSTVYAATYPTLSVGARGSSVMYLQERLNALGYNCGKVDGIFGPKTLTAVKAFQKAKHLTVDGIVGPKTWAALNSTSSTANSGKSAPSTSTSTSTVISPAKPAYPGVVLTLGSNGTAVREVQQRLNDLGYNCGPVDGVYGQQTRNAVMAFQKDHHLTVDGQVGPQTWGALFGVAVPTSHSFTNVDLRYPAPSSVTASQIDNWIAAHHPGDMEGLGQYFIEAQDTYGVNAVYLLAHAALETGWGTSALALNKNNWFGYGAYDGDAYGYGGTFPSTEYAIMFEAWEVRQNYLTPGASNYSSSPTLTGMNTNYASDPNWASSIGEIMREYVSETGGNDSEYIQYQPSNQPPAPASTTEPVYKISTDAIAEIASTSPYNSLPVFSSLTNDAANYFLYGVLSKTNSTTPMPAVKTLQQKLNQDPSVSSKLTVDGVFGPATEQAVKQYQQAHGLPVTGICDDATWATLFPATGTSLKKGQTYHIDEMAQFLTVGMSGGYKYFVTLWYHVAGYGWVPSTEVQLDNVYRVLPNTGFSVTVTGANGSVLLHRGDFVVTNGSGQLEVYNQQTGQLIVGNPSTPVTLQKFTQPIVHTN
jgi:peptidoglycan hydrolase-like protein with peptidoglycan-binding domain